MSTASVVLPPPRILIVDDERRNRDLLELMLLPEGYVIVTAESAEAALSILARESFDLFILDVMMPGANGYELTAIIKRAPATSHIPILLLTSLDDSNSRAHGLRAGAGEVLSKPVSRVALCSAVAALIMKPRHA